MHRPQPRLRPPQHWQPHHVARPHAGQVGLDFWVGRPDARLFPLRSWGMLLARALHSQPHQLCEYGDPQGMLALREAIVSHIGATRGIATDAGRVLDAPADFLRRRLDEDLIPHLVAARHLLPLLAGIRESLSYRNADKELIKQFRFMHRLFESCRWRLDRATTDTERRHLLRALGCACLEEHAEWILLHRERPLDAGSMSG